MPDIKLGTDHTTTHAQLLVTVIKTNQDIEITIPNYGKLSIHNLTTNHMHGH